MYKVLYHNYESNIGTLSECLEHIAIMMTDYFHRHQVTVKQAIDAGYRVVKA